MSTGSRPRMSSTCTSRTWRTAVAPVCSSSKTVGSVRTGMPRSRQQRTTFARSDARRRGDRDRDLVGLDLVEDPAELARRAEHAHAVDPQAALERVVVDEADGLEAELGVAQDLAQDEPAAVAGADDQQAARVLARAKAAQRALVDRARDEARAADEGEHEQQGSASTPDGSVTASRRSRLPRVTGLTSDDVAASSASVATTTAWTIAA